MAMYELFAVISRPNTREEGSANNTVKKQVTLFTIRENGENCLRLFQTIWNISAASADYMLFFTWYFLHTKAKGEKVVSR